MKTWEQKKIQEQTWMWKKLFMHTLSTGKVAKAGVEIRKWYMKTITGRKIQKFRKHWKWKLHIISKRSGRSCYSLSQVLHRLKTDSPKSWPPREDLSEKRRPFHIIKGGGNRLHQHNISASAANLNTTSTWTKHIPPSLFPGSVYSFHPFFFQSSHFICLW